MIEINAIALGHEVIIVGAGIMQFTPAMIEKREQAFLSVEDANIRVMFHGDDPAANTGHAVPSGSTLLIKGAGNLTRFRATREGLVNATIRVTYFA